MGFFTDPTEFTHHARFYGVPCYFKSDGIDGCTMAGTNVVFDWLICHFCPHLHALCEATLKLIEGPDYEPRGFRIELRGRLP